jgi:hypothetical protein
VSHYSINMRVVPSESKFEANARLTVTNTLAEDQSSISLLLYRLIDVKSAEEEGNRPVKYTQTLTRFTEEPRIRWRICIRSKLSCPL